MPPVRDKRRTTAALHRLWARIEVSRLLFHALAGRARIGMLRCPVFRGEGHAPEGWTRRGEFQTDFRFAGAHRTEEHYVAFLLLLRALVLEQNLAAAGEPRRQQNQGTVGVDGQRFGLFLDGFSLGIGGANAHGDLHQHTLAATPGYRRVRDLSHTTSLT